MRTFKCIGLKESLYLWAEYVEIGLIYELHGTMNAFETALMINDIIIFVDTDQFEEVK